MCFGNLYCAGSTPALHYALKFLKDAGISISDSPDWNTRHLLLDVPSFRTGQWTSETLDTLLAALPDDIIIWGGNLRHPSLESYQTMDLLQDEPYLLENADITADCTIPIAAAALKDPWPEVSVLVIGWGRIGKFLSEKLRNLGCNVTIASQNQDHREKASFLGFQTLDVKEYIASFKLIINTAPASVLSLQENDTSVKIDLASVKGLTGKDVIHARGLPGKYAPDRSGKLIADTILRLSKEVLS